MFLVEEFHTLGQNLLKLPVSLVDCVLVRSHEEPLDCSGVGSENLVAYLAFVE